MEIQYGLTPETYQAVTTLIDERLRRIFAPHQDYDRLANGQKRLESRMEGVESSLNRLAEAQARTEERVEQLTEAQARTEERVGHLEAAMIRLVEAQARTEERVGHLEAAMIRLVEAQARTEERVDRLDATVNRLIEAQTRTEERVGQLAEAQARTEKRVDKLVEAQARTEEELRRLIKRVDAIQETQNAMQASMNAMQKSMNAMQKSMNKMQRSIDALEESQKIMGDRQAKLIGQALEDHYFKRAPAYFGRVMRRVRAFMPADLADELETRLPEDDYLDLLLSDLFVRGRPKSLADAPQVWLAVEVSAVIDNGDVERAIRRAGHLREAGYPAAPIVAGEKATKGAEDMARKAGVAMVMNGDVAFWEAALAQAAPKNDK